VPGNLVRGKLGSLTTAYWVINEKDTGSTIVPRDNDKVLNPLENDTWEITANIKNGFRRL
jgi:hypothetical protein